jgi:peroxiredoxin (alkyl hydroperoxide reductase subunit C)
MARLLLARLVAVGLVAGSACTAPGDAPERLGPRDGHELSPADTGRVAVGDPAPDFSLESYRGEVVTLSDYRGSKDVVLVFYRGHW